MNEVDIKHTCSFTGHRPERLEMSENRVLTWLEARKSSVFRTEPLDGRSFIKAYRRIYRCTGRNKGNGVVCQESRP